MVDRRVECDSDRILTMLTHPILIVSIPIEDLESGVEETDLFDALARQSKSHSNEATEKEVEARDVGQATGAIGELLLVLIKDDRDAAVDLIGMLLEGGK